MDRLWAPWRKAYIRPESRKRKGCLFCRLLSGRNDAQNYILKRTPFSFAVLNLYPYTNGHILILPKRHVRSIPALGREEKLDWLALLGEVEQGLKKTLKPHGYNIGINQGRPSGAGVPGHLHLHIVPRWVGDTNFMPVLSGSRVISESLDSVYKTLRAAMGTVQRKQVRRKKGTVRKKSGKLSGTKQRRVR